jgi:hypothetical protein
MTAPGIADTANGAKERPQRIPAVPKANLDLWHFAIIIGSDSGIVSLSHLLMPILEHARESFVLQHPSVCSPF